MYAFNLAYKMIEDAKDQWLVLSITWSGIHARNDIRFIIANDLRNWYGRWCFKRIV
jgi:hypothetical protein